MLLIFNPLMGDLFRKRGMRGLLYIDDNLFTVGLNGQICLFGLSK